MTAQDEINVNKFLDKNLKFVIEPPKPRFKHHTIHLEDARKKDENSLSKIETDLIHGGVTWAVKMQFEHIHIIHCRTIASAWFEKTLRRTLKEAGLRKKDFVPAYR